VARPQMASPVPRPAARSLAMRSMNSPWFDGSARYSISTPKRSRNFAGSATRISGFGGPATTSLPPCRAAAIHSFHCRSHAAGPAALAAGAPAGAPAGAAAPHPGPSAARWHAARSPAPPTTAARRNSRRSIELRRLVVVASTGRSLIAAHASSSGQRGRGGSLGRAILAEVLQSGVAILVLEERANVDGRRE